MTETFAKLYEKKGRQLLVTKEIGDNDTPELHIRSTTTKSGHSMTLRLGFKDGDYSKRDAAFDKLDEKAAWKLIEGAPGAKM